MTTRITFVGGPSSGKSTTAADLFVQLKKQGKNAEMIQEWIRRDIMRNGPMKSTFEQYRTLMYNKREEENFPPHVEYLIHDGNTLLPYFYAALYADKDDLKDRLVIQDMYSVMLDDLYSRKYDLIYYLPRMQTDEAGAQIADGTRVQSPEECDLLDRYMRLLLTEVHRMDNVRVIDCPLNERTDWLLADILR
jgi:AAA domain